MKLFILTFFSVSFLTFSQTGQKTIVNRELTVIVNELGKSNLNLSDLEKNTKIDKKNFTSILYFNFTDKKGMASYPINDKTFNWAYFNKNVYPRMQSGEKIKAKIFISVYHNKINVIDSIKIN